MKLYKAPNGPDNWDAAGVGGNTARTWVSPMIEYLFIGDIEKYGPRGTNEYDFVAYEYIPEQYLRGNLAESWSWPDPYTIVIKIRQGCYFTGREGGKYYDVLEEGPREFTAEDAAFNLNRQVVGAIELWGTTIYDYIDTITDTDTYTLTIKVHEYYTDWAFHIGYAWLGEMYAPESIEADATDWRNLVGTGPFILYDYVEGSKATYHRNPDYRGTTTIDGVEYETPFIDKLILPIIEDESTAIASLRTGRIDWTVYVPLMYADTLADTAPDLIQDKYLEGSCYLGALWWGQEPWTDRDVRRALMIGTDYDAIIDSIYGGEALKHCWPYNGLYAPIYTPFEELPESAKELYSHDVAKAAQLIIDAGYTTGIKMKLNVSSTNLVGQDICAMLMEQWAEIGVEAEMEVVEQAVFTEYRTSRDWEDYYAMGMANVNPMIALGSTGLTPGWGAAHYVDDYFVGKYWEAAGTRDMDEQAELWKALGIYYLEECPYIPGPNPYVITAYWPWLKNYYGEVECGYWNFVAMTSTLWIDEDLKAELGY